MNKKKTFATVITEEFRHMARSQFEKIIAEPLPIYIMRFEGRIKSEDSTHIINKSELRELTFSELFVASRDPGVLKKFIGEGFYLKGRGIEGTEGHRKIMEDGRIGGILEIRSLNSIPREMVVYVYPGNGKQFVRVNDRRTGPLFVLGGAEYEIGIEMATAVAGRRKIPGLEGLSGQQGWIPEIEHRLPERIIDAARELLNKKAISFSPMAIEDAKETVKEFIKIFR